MSQHRFVLHARSFAGPLCAPTRNELQTAEGDNRQALEEIADTLRERGFRCWLYERSPARPGGIGLPGKTESFYVLTEWHPIE